MQRAALQSWLCHSCVVQLLRIWFVFLAELMCKGTVGSRARPREPCWGKEQGSHAGSSDRGEATVCVPAAVPGTNPCPQVPHPHGFLILSGIRIPPGQLCQSWTALSKKKFSQISNINLPWNNLEPFLLSCSLFLGGRGPRYSHEIHNDPSELLNQGETRKGWELRGDFLKSLKRKFGAVEQGWLELLDKILVFCPITKSA